VPIAVFADAAKAEVFVGAPLRRCDEDAHWYQCQRGVLVTSIGPDSSVPLVISVVEFVVLVDDERGIVVDEAERGLDRATVAGDVAQAMTSTICFVGDRSRSTHDRSARLRARRADRRRIVTLREFERAIRSWASASANGRARLETDLRTHCCASRRPIIAAPPTGSLVDWSRAAPTVALRGGGGARCALLVM